MHSVKSPFSFVCVAGVTSNGRVVVMLDPKLVVENLYPFKFEAKRIVWYSYCLEYIDVVVCEWTFFHILLSLFVTSSHSFI